MRKVFLVLIILGAGQKAEFVEKRLNLREQSSRNDQLVNDFVSVFSLKTKLALPVSVKLYFLHWRREPLIFEKVANSGGRRTTNRPCISGLNNFDVCLRFRFGVTDKE